MLLDGRFIGEPNWARFDSPMYNRLLRRAARLRGPARYRAYGDLDVRLARDAAPMVALDFLNDPASSRSGSAASRRRSTSPPSASSNGHGACTVTQTTPPATAIPAGALPRSIVRTTSFVAGSMRETVPSPAFATQIAPAPTATAAGSSPTRIVKRGVRARVDAVDGVVTPVRDPERSLAEASAAGRWPTLIVRIGPSSNVLGSKRWTVESAAFATQTAPPPTTTAVGLAPASVDPRGASRRIDPGERRVAVDDPDVSGPIATAPSWRARRGRHRDRVVT